MSDAPTTEQTLAVAYSIKARLSVSPREDRVRSTVVSEDQALALVQGVEMMAARLALLQALQTNDEYTRMAYARDLGWLTQAMTKAQEERDEAHLRVKILEGQLRTRPLTRIP